MLLPAEIKVFADLDAMSRQAAGRFVRLANQRVAENRLFTAALSGGSTPRRLYEILGAALTVQKIPWANTHLFQVDERCVPPDHVESNYRMIRETLLSHGAVPESNFHRMAAELADRDEAARQYAEELRRVLRPKPNEWPRLDLVLLGMGPDGHTASLFPGSGALDVQVHWVVPNYVERLKACRLTLTLPVLNAAGCVIFLVAGEDKAETVRQVLEASSGPDRFPAQRVRPTNGQVSWYLDEAAAALL
ncbi:MAG TPA: 6-phosphogluconolactonase [Terriglobia bacterium]|nr:6-phosphogluconolactonase [Terriglobia bacterium]